MNQSFIIISMKSKEKNRDKNNIFLNGWILITATGPSFVSHKY